VRIHCGAFASTARAPPPSSLPSRREGRAAPPHGGAHARPASAPRAATPEATVPQRASAAFVTPMAAPVVTKLPEGPDWIYELKFDGYRAMIIKDNQRVELRSRKNKELTGMYPGLAAAGSRLDTDQAVKLP
jgi:ATP-dependent DNA ligase